MQQLIGKVTNAKNLPTVKVEVTRRWTHPLYHKTITKRKSYLAECEISVAAGDRVILTLSRPISKMKRWKVSKKL